MRKIVVALDNTYYTAATSFGFADLIPQITDGTQILSTTYTPLFADSTLLIEYEVSMCADGGTTVAVALFNGAANAIDACSIGIQAVDFITHCASAYSYAPGSTAAITFSLRAAAAGGHTWYVNGTSAGRRLGGSLYTTLKITEFKNG